MAAAPFLALLMIAILMLAALRLELNFRRTAEEGSEPEPRKPAPGRDKRRPELRAAPAGGYWQAPLSAPPFRRAGPPVPARNR
jgi:hypothetical protein